MKKCPACGTTFEDSMKFCQIDGTELIADEPAFDPYATVVGHKLDLPPESAKSSDASPEEVVLEPLDEAPPAASGEPAIHETTGSIPIAPPDEMLELPGVDPLKTMYVSDSELKEVLGREDADQALTEESINAEPPLSGSGGMAPPPSPFSTPEVPFDQPFERSSDADAETVLAQNAPPPFKEPDPVQWTTPPAPDMSSQNKPMAANAPFQPAPTGTDGQSNGLAIGSLVSGILSCTVCCSMGIFLGPVALVMGFMAKKKAEEDPSTYGGRGMALGGMITGAVGILFGIGIILYYIIVGVAVFSGTLPN